LKNFCGLVVEHVEDGEMTVEEIDRDFAVLASLCWDSEPADEEPLDGKLHAAGRQAAEQGRREPGLAATGWDRA
jgi:hypothetical protein